MSKARNSVLLIQDAAAREFARFGFSGARVDRIAQSAGVNKQLIYYYFTNKRGLYRGVLKGASRELSDILLKSVGVEDRFRAAFAELFGALAARPELTALTLIIARDPDQKAVVEGFVEGLSRIVSDGQGLGLYRDDVDPDAIARHAISTLVGYFSLQSTVFDPEQVQPHDWLRNVTTFFAATLNW